MGLRPMLVWVAPLALNARAEEATSVSAEGVGRMLRSVSAEDAKELSCAMGFEAKLSSLRGWLNCSCEELDYS